MTDEETVQKLMNLRMGTMAQAFRDLLTQAPGSQLSFSEQVALMVDREWTDRENRKLERLMRAARLSVSDASLENVWCDPARGIDKAMIRDLATGKWIQNLRGRLARAGRVPQRNARPVCARPAPATRTRDCSC
jgi:DNA replication protein DnaC